MLQELHEVTGISIEAIQGAPMHQFSINERLSWAENRRAKRGEDEAYSLFGTFDIYMPILHGEGRRNAFARLKRRFSETAHNDHVHLETQTEGAKVTDRSRTDQTRPTTRLLTMESFGSSCFILVG
jgi:hypothetical protein